MSLPSSASIASPNRLVLVPQRETQLFQESQNRILDIESQVYRLNRKIKKFSQEDSKAGIITEVCTEPSTASEAEANESGPALDGI